jgi:putative hydrolase of the HAD superfamily
MKKLPKTFIFDCFGVIYEPFLMGWYKDHSRKHDFVDEQLHEVLKNFDLGKFSEEDILDYFLKYKGVTLNKSELRDHIDSYLKVDTKLVDVIKQLKSVGYKIVMLSNANHTFFDRKIYPIFPEFKDIFDEIVISSQVGMVKPNADIFLYTLEKINILPEEALFIDDSQSNITAAEQLGIRGYLYTNYDSFVNFLESENLNS